MPKQQAKERVNNWDEVALGYSVNEAQQEADRCLQCKKPLCVEGCPVNINIPRFVKLIAEGKFDESFYSIKDKNNLPAICGRVCPQEEQCEAKCILGKRGEPVAIGSLERFIADYGIDHSLLVPKPSMSQKTKVAVVGSGPAGLTAAADLARKGYHVTIFEALHTTGGVLRYGIPEFRLPKWVLDDEVKRVKRLGVEIKLNHVIGKILTIDELLEMGFKAVFIGTGAGLPVLLNLPGMNSIGVYSANEFLTRINLMKAYRFPEFDTPVIVGKHTLVIGGGNVALDAARVALRMGAEKVTVLYRRTRKEMPAREEEIINAMEEGVNFKFLAQPISVKSDEKGYVKEIRYVKCELGPEDESGRRRSIPTCEEFSIAVDTVVCATGQNPNPLIPHTTPGLELNRWGGIKVDPKTLATSRKGVYAGGDIVTGAATVILAMAAGQLAAKSIDQYIKSLRQ
ncbi:MAG: NADPH-dependent glutamate synthase [Candidatus Ranarchaeia archaeon]